ncbi:tryptophan synthase subunit alpha, partial [Lachnotalea glycerini]
MNRIEKRLQELKIENKKALITYMTAGLSSLQGTKDIILAQDEAGCDGREPGVPESDPGADGP